MSNSVKVMKKIKQDEIINCTDASNESNVTRKVLGITWDLKPETIIFYFDELVNEILSLFITKRSILKTSAKTFYSRMDQVKIVEDSFWKIWSELWA